MKCFTKDGCEIPAFIPGLGKPATRVHQVCTGVNRRSRLIPFPFVLLFTVLFQVAFAQGPITGRVSDEKGAPLPGVSVTAKGSTSGASTNDNGRYSINVPAGADSLLFSYVGYAAQSVAINGQSTINVSLTPESKALTDVVVVGYGRQKKVNLVGSVSTVTVDERLSGRAVPNVSSGLSGLVPGLAATQNSGMAGRNGANLLIRGLGTVNNANPLIVVDGMPDADINRIDMNDIESISVLKDATSASVYGSRAANGVILITTKSGKGMKRTVLNFTSNSGLTKPTRAYDFMADYPRALTLEQRRAATNTAPANQLFKNGTIDQWMALGMIDPLRYPNTDWWDIILRDGTLQTYNLSASGGNDLSNFFISVGKRDEKGLQINNDYQQYNARFNFDYKIRKNMNAGARFNGDWSKMVYALEEGFTDPDPSNTAGFDMRYAIAGITPYDPVSGKFGGVMAYGEDPQAYNPYTVYVNMLNRQNRQEANGNVYLDWTPIKGLTAAVDYGLRYYNMFRWNANMPNQAYNFQTSANGSRVYVGANAGIFNATNTGYKTILNGRLNYHTTFGKNHDLSGLFVYSEEFWYDRFQGSARNDRLHTSLTEVDAALPGIQTATGNSSTEGLRSYIGRVNYTAFNKYLLEANMRVDGSSKFLHGRQYGYFPSVALGWRFSEEKFLRRLFEGVLSNGKLRVSYGSLGNNSGVGRFEQQTTLEDNLYILDGVVTRGFVNAKMVNPLLSWETTSVLNTGLELSFLGNRLTTEFDYYDRLTTGMNRPSDLSILLSGAYMAPRRNIGNLRNRGVEGTISWKDRIGKLSYGTTVNASFNRTNLEQWNEYLGRDWIFLNMPYHFLYTYEDIGIAQTWPDVYNATPQGAQPGDVLRVDLNGDGRIDGNDRKAYPRIQRDRPTTNFALNGFAAWKGFDVAFLFQGAAGRKTYWINAFNDVNFSTARYAATWSHWNNPWSLDNRDGAWPRLGGSGNNQAETSFWLDDLSYLRFKNIQLGYAIPKRLLQRLHVNNLRVAGSAENLWTLTSYRGQDPEKQGNSNNMYPVNKSYSLVVQLGF